MSESVGGSVVVMDAPTRTKTLSRLERTNMETPPRHSDAEIRDKTKTVYIKEKLGQNKRN